MRTKSVHGAIGLFDFARDPCRQEATGALQPPAAPQEATLGRHIELFDFIERLDFPRR